MSLGVTAHLAPTVGLGGEAQRPHLLVENGEVSRKHLRLDYRAALGPSRAKPLDNKPKALETPWTLAGTTASESSAERQLPVGV